MHQNYQVFTHRSRLGRSRLPCPSKKCQCQASIVLKSVNFHMSAQAPEKAQELFLVAYDIHCDRDGLPRPPPDQSPDLVAPLDYDSVTVEPVTVERKTRFGNKGWNIVIPSDLKLVSLIDRGEPLQIAACPKPAPENAGDALLELFGLRLVKKGNLKPGEERLDQVLDRLLCPHPPAGNVKLDVCKAKSLWNRQVCADVEYVEGCECGFEVANLGESACHLHNYGVSRKMRVTLFLYHEQVSGRDEIQKICRVDVGDIHANTRGFVMVVTAADSIELRAVSWSKYQRKKGARQQREAPSCNGLEYPPTGACINMGPRWKNEDEEDNDVHQMNGSIPCDVSHYKTQSEIRESTALSVSELRALVNSYRKEGHKVAYLDDTCSTEEGRTDLAKRFFLQQIASRSGEARNSAIVVNTKDDAIAVISCDKAGSSQPRTIEWAKIDVFPFSPTDHQMSVSWFTLRCPTIFFEGKSVPAYTVHDVFIDSASLMFVAATDVARQEIVILAGEAASQSLDDMYICGSVSGIFEDSSFAQKEQGIVCAILSRGPVARDTKRTVSYFQFQGNARNLVPLRAVGPEAGSVVQHGSAAFNLIGVSKDGTVVLAERGKKQYCNFAPKQGTGCQTPVSTNDAVIDRFVSIDGEPYGVRPDGSKFRLLDDREIQPPVQRAIKLRPIATKIAALEVDQRLYLLTHINQTCFYRPAMRNVLKKANILSMFHRYLRHGAPVHIDDDHQLPNKICLTAVIDIGLHESARRTFRSGTAPGVYIEAKKGKYSHDTEIPVTSLNIHFNNGSLPVGLDQHRTICQLWASFCYSTRIYVYGPGKAFRIYHTTDVTFGPRERIEYSKSALLALYGTLLSLDPQDLDLAIGTLEVTKNNAQEFQNFLKRIKH